MTLYLQQGNDYDPLLLIKHTSSSYWKAGLPLLASCSIWMLVLIVIKEKAHALLFGRDWQFDSPYKTVLWTIWNQQRSLQIVINGEQSRLLEVVLQSPIYLATTSVSSCLKTMPARTSTKKLKITLAIHQNTIDKWLPDVRTTIYKPNEFGNRGNGAPHDCRKN